MSDEWVRLLASQSWVSTGEIRDVGIEVVPSCKFDM